MSEEINVIVESVKEFIEKEILLVSDNIEREGINKELISKLAEKGYFGIILPENKGGIGLDEFSYCLVLKEFAKISPSLAIFLYFQNSLVIPILANESKSEFAKSYLEKILKGEAIGTIPIDDFNQYKENYLEYDINSGKIKGIKNYVLISNSNFILTLASKGETLVLIDEIKFDKVENLKLGFRALPFSKIIIDSEIKSGKILIEKEAKAKLNKIYEESSLHLASIALGISREALSRAKEYSKKRKAFGKYLHEFQPLAFNISQNEIEIEAIESYLSDVYKKGEKEKYIGVKIATFELARKVAKLALQVHGGYGYFEDFKIERFYRDSMSLTALFSNFVFDRSKISKYYIESISAEY